VTPQGVAELALLVEGGQLNLSSAKAVLAEMFVSGGSPSAIAEGHSLAQLNDPGEIARLVEAALSSHPAQVEQYLAGKTAIAQWLFGQVMRSARGRANPALVQKLLQDGLRAMEENRRAS
jgi:aspartyl-tRNA(Asn)/glutamyl-tRNA(Gln) amidotransferase subunit B